jgi:pimeloyl-ACP methyl ester carboxylesterase
MARGSFLTRLVLAAVLLLALLPSAAPAAAWRPCAGPDGTRCATVRVPLDRSGALPGEVPLRVARLQAGAAAPTLVYLSGGPGGAGIEEMLSVLPLVPALDGRYQVVGFDQRGTGRSGLLRCPALERDPRLRSVSAGAECARRLGEARHFYTTQDSVADLEAIRAELGVERLTLFGISYGTELALAYARAHPDRVDRLILDSVVDPDDRDPFGLAGFRAIAPSLAGLCPRGCRGVTDDPAADLARLAARLRSRPVRGEWFDRRGRRHARSLGQTAVADLLYDSDYNPPLRAAVPAAVRAALAGDAAPLARLAAEGSGLASLPSPRSFSSARYATVCEETPLPWDASTPLADRLAVTRARAAEVGAAAFAPFDLETASADEIGLCLQWPGVPSGRVPAPAAPYPAVPTLLLQGAEDLRTPPEASASVAAAIPGSVRVVVPGVGHAVVGADPSGCGVRAVTRFVEGRSVAGTCRRVPTGVPAVPLPPRRLRSVAPAPGLRGVVGRTAAAIGLTVDDLAFSLSPAFLAYSGGGLRGGSFAVRRRSVVVRDFEAVGGVRVSGVARGGVLRLRVGGPAAAPGRVRVTGGSRVRGRLGGRRVDVVLRSSAAVAASAATPSSPAGPAAPSAATPSSPAATGAPSARDPYARVFRAPFLTKSSHPRLVPSPAR